LLGVPPAATAAAIAVHVRQRSSSAGDQSNVQSAIEVLTAEEGRGAQEDAGTRQGAAEKLASGELMLATSFRDPLLHRGLLAIGERE
jgi:hypothetical protein